MMTSAFKSAATFLSALLCVPLVSSGEDSAGFFEVVTVTPARVIEHEVELKGPFDKKVTATRLNGPQRFSHHVGLAENPIPEPRAYLNWYKIENPSSRPRRLVTLRGGLGVQSEQEIAIDSAAFLLSPTQRIQSEQEIAIDSAAFLLSPTQRITTGSPSHVPDGLGHFVAYRIIDALQVEQPVQLSGCFGPKKRIATRPTFLCVPVEQWHHEEHFKIKNPKDCQLVYEAKSDSISLSITSIDQFGLNELQAAASCWIAVPVRIVKTRAEEAE
jgi:hypothetical protein